VQREDPRENVDPSATTVHEAPEQGLAEIEVYQCVI
jgi:S-adenosylmethionine/arginine decarboxylase-like enzyme